MRLSSLEILRFRNLRHVALPCAAGLNLLLGANASGKTSLLEALYFLGRGRSFRTRQPRDLIQSGAEAFRIVATLADSAGRRLPVGVERSTREMNLRVGGTPTRSLAELARQVPVLLLNPDSHRLLEDGPQWRRQFMDWGLFHSEPSFLELWRRYSVALRHRNAALRAGAPNRLVDAWDQDMAAAVSLDQLRSTFCEALGSVLAPLAVATLGEGAVQVEYRRGWPLAPPERDFIDWLHAGRDQDRQQAHTRLGPHRADFTLRIAGKPPAESLSRGQQKLLVIALVLAQAALYRRHNGDSCILLIDDLPAELDPGNRGRVMQALAEIDSQLFITAIEAKLLDAVAWGEAQTFQLSHGELCTMV